MGQTDKQKSLLIEEETPVRQDPRILFATHAVLVLDNGVEVSGETKDVSFSGAFLLTETSPPAGIQGMQGVIQLDVRREGAEEISLLAFPCHVARLTEEGVGLTFREEE